MIKKYIERLFGRRERVTHKDAKPVVYAKDKHGIDREAISRCTSSTSGRAHTCALIATCQPGCTSTHRSTSSSA